MVQYFLHFILTSRWIGFCNVECQMLNVGRNLTHVRQRRGSAAATTSVDIGDDALAVGRPVWTARSGMASERCLAVVLATRRTVAPERSRRPERPVTSLGLKGPREWSRAAPAPEK